MDKVEAIENFFDEVKDANLEEFKDKYSELKLKDKVLLNKCLMELYSEYKDSVRHFSSDIEDIITYLKKEKTKLKHKKKGKKNYDIEIVEFFEYERNDTIDEFKINLEHFNYSDKNKLKNQLIKLYKDYLSQNIIDIYSTNDDRFIEQSKDICKRIDEIIKYLYTYETKEEKEVCTKEKYNIITNDDNYEDKITESAFENLKNYSLKKAIQVFINSIKNRKIDEYLIEQAKCLVYKYIEEENLDKESMFQIFHIENAIKYRLSKIDKKDKIKRKKLKDIKKIFDYVLCKYIDDIKDIDSSLFNLLDYFIYHEDYYNYLKQIVDLFPEIINLKYNNKHILLYITNVFIDNYKIMLQTKKDDYINKDYLKNIYLLFLRSSYLSIKKDDLYEVNKKLKQFAHDIDIMLTSSKRKNTIKDDLEDMYVKNMYFDKSYEFKKNVDNFKLENDINSIGVNLKRGVNSSKRIDMTDDITITIGDGLYAYSLDEMNDRAILKVHVLDLYSSIIKDSNLENYLYNLVVTNKDIDIFIKNAIRLRKNDIIPTITYEIEISNNIELIDIYRSKIKVQRQYHRSEIDDYLKPYIKLTNEYDVFKIDKVLNSFLDKSIAEYANDNNIPFIYSGCSLVEENDINRLLNDINHMLSKLKKKDFKSIYKIIDNNKSPFHYDINPFIGEYNLYVNNPINYVGLMIQRVMHEIVLEDRNTEEEKELTIKKYEHQIEHLIAILNCSINYVDSDVLKENKGRLKKKRKMYF